MPVETTLERRCDRAFLGILSELPEVATLLSVGERDGLTLDDDTLTDWSPAGEATRLAKMTAAHAALAVGGESDPPAARRTRAVFREFLEHPTFEPLVGVAGEAFAQHPYLVCQEGGIQTELPLFFVNLHPLAGAGDAERYLAKLERVPRAVAGVLESLRARESRGLLPPRFLLEQAHQEVRAFTAATASDNPLTATFAARLRARRGAAGLDDRAIDALATRVADAVARCVYPAYLELDHFLAGQIERAPVEPGVWRLPDGDAYYAYELRCQTSTDLGPEAIHRLGLEEIARLQSIIHAEFDALRHPRGSLAERYGRLAADPAARWSDGVAGRDAILARCRELLDSVGGRLGEAFGTLPQAPLVVQPVPAFCEAARTTTLHPASPGDARPAILELNLAREAGAPRWELPTLVYHEGLPGHHLQLAIAQEHAELSLFRRKVIFHAYIEGWAKYAEQLPWEMGWNSDPVWRLGALRRELISSANLALDTGIHHRRWTREAGIRFCAETTGMDESFARYLVDRIAARPAQTCSYKVGLTKLRELRARAERSGPPGSPRFSLRGFHDAVLRHGALPLGELDSATLEGESTS